MTQKTKYRAPYVLEIGRPIGTNAESLKAQRDFDVDDLARKMAPRLEEMMRRNWYDPEYWKRAGLVAPSEPFPGLAAIREQTGVR